MIDITSLIVWGSLGVLIIYGWATTKSMKNKRNKKNRATDLADQDEPISICDTLETQTNFKTLEQFTSIITLKDHLSVFEPLTHYADHTFKLHELEKQVDELLECIHNDFFMRVAGSNIEDFFHSENYISFNTANFTLIELTILYKIFSDERDVCEEPVKGEILDLMIQTVNSSIASRITATSISNKQYQDKVDEISNFFSEDFGI